MGNLDRIHPPREKEELLGKLAMLMEKVYGFEKGRQNYTWLVDRIESYLDSLSQERLESQINFNGNRPYDSLAGKVFAISYPDNVYENDKYTLETLGNVLSEHFPQIGGLHILPERPMSHGDFWPQDLFDVVEPKKAQTLIEQLQQKGYLDANRLVTDKLESDEQGLDEFKIPSLKKKLSAAYNSHFNDGGFSQKTRNIVDPRFGTSEHITSLSNKYEVMLDYVVNHLDSDSDALEAYRQGKGTGEAFVIIDPLSFEKYKSDGTLAVTFRPRPFPLFTGMRKYPKGGERTDQSCVELMNGVFEKAGLKPLEREIILLLSIWYKLVNDQGLTARDKRVFGRFESWAEKNKLDLDMIFRDSLIQSHQKIPLGPAAERLDSFCAALGYDEIYGSVFSSASDEIFGEIFYFYTTFSESQADLNPVSDEGFQMVFNDMFSLMGDGDLAMMRMDAIKYLWKEIGKKNFDMDEGNQLIEIIRLVLTLSSPKIRPLDEVNSPDPVVYNMGKEGGFYYLFGQVNAVVAAFNQGSLTPLEHLNEMMVKQCASDLVLFVMLSTHDGRSVQGLGVDRSDGHISIEGFYALQDAVVERGGKPKYRSVTKGQLPVDTFNKICKELGWADFKESLEELFIREGDQLILQKTYTRETLMTAIAVATGYSSGTLVNLSAVDFWINWSINGVTPYELCSTSRSAFTMKGIENPGQEAARLALAQLYVLTMGQVVPAIYMNDLFGLENDQAAYDLSGRPRDLNRHKSHVNELDFSKDPFQAVYVPLMNKMINLRSEDSSFYPGDANFEFLTPGVSVFLNHAYAGGDHTLVLGNISTDSTEILIPLNELAGVKSGEIDSLEDKLSGTIYPLTGGVLNLTLEGFQGLWLKTPGGEK